MPSVFAGLVRRPRSHTGQMPAAGSGGDQTNFQPTGGDPSGSPSWTDPSTWGSLLGGITPTIDPSSLLGGGGSGGSTSTTSATSSSSSSQDNTLAAQAAQQAQTGPSLPPVLIPPTPAPAASGGRNWLLWAAGAILLTVAGFFGYKHFEHR